MMRQNRKNPPLILVITIDILLIGVGLILFALFHHVIPRDIKTSGLLLPVSTKTSATTQPSFSSTALLSSDTTAASEHTTENGAWGVKFADKFTAGLVEKTDTSYRSVNMNIRITKVHTNNITYFVADIYLRDLKYLRTAFAGGSFAHGRADEVLNMASKSNAILAMSGDYCGIRDIGVVIRNGQLYREAAFDDVGILNNDGLLQTFTRTEFDMDQIKANGAWQAWAFGPMLLDGGQPMTTFNSKVNPKNPRAALGFYEPGHYCFVLVDGRQPGYSEGMTLKELSQLFYDLGCTAAYNLDGGESAVMTFDGKITNSPYNDGRQVSDIVYIGE